MKTILLVGLLGLFSCKGNCSTQVVDEVKDSVKAVVEPKKERYFLIGFAYNFDGGNGQGSMSVTFVDFPTQKELTEKVKKSAQESEGFKFKQIVIVSISELSEQDYKTYYKN